MRKAYFLNSYLILVILFVSVGLFSCSSTKRTKYFQDIPDSGQLKTIAKADYSEPKIQIDDIIAIVVQTIDPQATMMINMGNLPVAGVANPSVANASALLQQTTSGYLVDKRGDVEIPVLGKLNVVGLTTPEIRDKVQALASKYYKDPTVIVRLVNFKVSITGEVLRPGQYILPNEKVSILDAIAIAGDLTIFGKRENVLLIRENEDGSKTPYRINLKKSDLMSSPYYYLKQNDIIYVEPNKGKAAAVDASQARNYTIAASVLSIIAIILTRK